MKKLIVLSLISIFTLWSITTAMAKEYLEEQELPYGLKIGEPMDNDKFVPHKGYYTYMTNNTYCAVFVMDYNGKEVISSIEMSVNYPSKKMNSHTNTEWLNSLPTPLTYYNQWGLQQQILSQLKKLGAHDIQIEEEGRYWIYTFIANSGPVPITGSLTVKTSPKRKNFYLSSLEIDGSKWLKVKMAKENEDERKKEQKQERGWRLAEQKQEEKCKWIKQNVKKDPRALTRLPFGIKIGVTTNEEIENKGTCLKRIAVTDSYFRCKAYDMQGKFIVNSSQNEVVSKLYFGANANHILPRTWRNIGLELNKTTSKDFFTMVDAIGGEDLRSDRRMWTFVVGDNHYRVWFDEDTLSALSITEAY